MKVAALIERLFTADPSPTVAEDVDTWWRAHREREVPTSAARAVLGGFAADRLGWAFASGYQSAGEALFGDGSPSRDLGALCATEKGGVHPRAIETTLVEHSDGELRLNGRKSFVTFGSEATALFVVAKAGQRHGGLVDLRVVRITPRSGVTVTPQEGVPFCPEVPHASLQLDEVRVTPEEVLEGDGYLAYLKPFRTVEDIHVHLGLLGWLVQVGRRSTWPTATIARLLSSVVTLHALAEQDPSAPATHVALGGALADITALVDDLDWSSVDEPTRSRWQRDHALMTVAGKARAKRLEAAWRALGTGAG